MDNAHLCESGEHPTLGRIGSHPTTDALELALSTHDSDEREEREQIEAYGRRLGKAQEGAG